MTYVEKSLYDYKANLYTLYLLKQERKELASLTSTSFIPLERSDKATPSDPVHETVHKAMKIEKKISDLKRNINSVNKLKNDLYGKRDAIFQQMATLLKLKYIEHYGNDSTREVLCISWSTFWRRNRELLRLASKYFVQEH